MNTIVNRVRTQPDYAQKLIGRLEEMLVSRGYSAGRVFNEPVNRQSLQKQPIRTAPHPLTKRVIEIVFLSPIDTPANTNNNNPAELAPIQSYKSSSPVLEHYSQQLFKIYLAERKQDDERVRQLRDEQGYDSVMFISPHLLTGIILKRIRNLPIEYWFEGELFINPLQHHLVPTHRVLSDPDAKAIVDKFGLDNIPRLPQDDIVARYLYLQPNQIVEIAEINMITLSQIKYRRVVPSLLDHNRNMYLKTVLVSGVGSSKAATTERTSTLAN